MSRLLVLSVAIAFVVAGCATTFDEDATVSTTVAPQVAPTTLPSGPASVLFDAMAERMAELSELLVETGGPRADDLVSEIEALWERARPEVAIERPELLADLDRVVGLCRTAADRRRPADADRAVLHFATLVDAYEAA